MPPGLQNLEAAPVVENFVRSGAPSKIVVVGDAQVARASRRSPTGPSAVVVRQRYCQFRNRRDHIIRNGAPPDGAAVQGHEAPSMETVGLGRSLMLIPEPGRIDGTPF